MGGRTNRGQVRKTQELWLLYEVHLPGFLSGSLSGFHGSTALEVPPWQMFAYDYVRVGACAVVAGV